jgi:transcriptional regulator with XRE-family HTH domain
MLTINEQARLALSRELTWQAITQRDLASAMGISEKHLSHVMNGRSGPSLMLLDRAAQELGCTWHIGLNPPDDELS